MGTKSATSVLQDKNEAKLEYDDILDTCRLCMERNKNMKNIFSVEQSKIVEKVEFCTGLQLTQEEGLPSHVCDTCLDNLTIAYTFKTMCLTSNEKYRNLIPKIKLEHRDTDFNNHFDDVDDSKDCKDILREMLKLNDIKISRIKFKNNNCSYESKPVTTKRRAEPNSSKSQVKASVKTKQPSKHMKKVKVTKLQCDVCNLYFTNKVELSEHKKEAHKESETFICEICGKVMLHRASLYTHVRSHLPPQFACDSCDYKTWHKHDLAKHRRIHAGLKMYQCEFCTASYYTSSNLRSHIRFHHEGMPKRFPCRLCDRSFYDKTKLKRHIDSHNDIKRFECEVCHSCFTRRCYWKKHMDRQHGVVIPAVRPGPQKMNLILENSASMPTAPHAKTDVVTIGDPATTGESGSTQ